VPFPRRSKYGATLHRDEVDTTIGEGGQYPVPTPQVAIKTGQVVYQGGLTPADVSGGIGSRPCQWTWHPYSSDGSGGYWSVAPKMAGTYGWQNYAKNIRRALGRQ
jgi:hypothetical protein